MIGRKAKKKKNRNGVDLGFLEDAPGFSAKGTVHIPRIDVVPEARPMQPRDTCSSGWQAQSSSAAKSALKILAVLYPDSIRNR